MLRTTTEHNTLFIAPVERIPGLDTKDALASKASQCSAALGLGGIDLGALVDALPSNRHQVYFHS